MIAGVSSNSPDGMSPREQLDAIRGRVQALVTRKMKVFETEIRPLLRARGVQIADWDDLKKGDREELRRVFDERVYPVLTPLAVDPAHPFPYISDLSLNLAVIVREPKSTIRRFARVKIPPLLPRFVKVPGSRRYVPLEQVVAAHLDRLFPGMKIVTHNPFRVTRDAELEVEVDEADDLLATLESLLRTRRRSPEAVRLEVTTSMPRDLKSILLRELGLTNPDVYVIDGLLALGDLWSLTELTRPASKEKRWTGITPPRLGSVLGEPRDVFAVLRKGDMLVHHPYDRFATSVEAFVDQAADDPDVLAIKQTLYRTSDEGEAPIVRSLMRAAEAGKEVLALVELTARGDEEKNIAWARTLEKAGVHVVHGVVGLKTHAKTVLVVRQEGDAIRRYCHVASGNYNPETATTYEDVGLLSADPELTADVADLFNSLTGYSSAAQLPQDPRRAGRTQAPPPGADRRGSRGEGRPDRHQDEQPRRHGDDRGARARGRRRHRDRSDRSRHLLPAAGREGTVADPGALDRRDVPRALAHLPLRERRPGRALLDRLGRPDAAEPRPPGRVPRARDRSRADRAARGDPRGEPGRRPARLGARAGRVDEGPDQDRHQHAPTPPGARRRAGAARRVGADHRRAGCPGLGRGRGEASRRAVVSPPKHGRARQGVSGSEGARSRLDDLRRHRRPPARPPAREIAPSRRRRAKSCEPEGLGCR